MKHVPATNEMNGNLNLNGAGLGGFVMADAVAYARFSMEEQDKQSISTQFAKIDEQAAKNGDRIIHPFSDEGKSWRTADREHLMEMFDAIKSGKLKVEKIYV